MQIDHPALTQVEVRHGIGRIEAEQFLRGLSSTDPAAAKAVGEIDARRKKLKETTAAANRASAKALALTDEQAAALVAKLAADRVLYSWLTTRVHQTMAHDRPLALDE